MLAAAPRELPERIVTTLVAMAAANGGEPREAGRAAAEPEGVGPRVGPGVLDWHRRSKLRSRAHAGERQGTGVVHAPLPSDRRGYRGADGRHLRSAGRLGQGVVRGRGQGRVVQRGREVGFPAGVPRRRRCGRCGSHGHRADSTPDAPGPRARARPPERSSIQLIAKRDRQHARTPSAAMSGKPGARRLSQSGILAVSFFWSASALRLPDSTVRARGRPS